MSKIILISPKDNNFYNFRSELILSLKDLGCDVVLICPYGEKINFFTKRNCRFIDVPIDRRGTSFINDFKLLWNYRKILKKEKPDIVLLYTTKCSVYGGLVCRMLKVPYIVNNAGLIDTTNSNIILKIILNLLYKIGFGKANCMMYQNKYERDRLNRVLKYKVYYRDIPGSGVNLEEFKYIEYPKENNIIVFNYVARIVEIKGINEFLECAKIIKNKYSNVQFNIYGDYDEEKYKKIIEFYQKQGIIQYKGVLKDMKPAIKESQAVIHPSYYEGMTNVILEHAASGRVAIASNIPGCKEGIDEGKTGYLFEVKNINSMVEKVEKFIKLPYKDKEQMGKEARKKMEKEFDRSIVTNIYLEEINKIL